MIVALDTETGGSDMRHGCRPFFVSTVNDAGKALTWEWDVRPTGPRSRHPIILKGDIQEIQDYLDEADRLVLHNTRFDFLALQTVGVKVDHLWEKTDDTLIASHVHNSLEPHGLKALCLRYLMISDDDETELQVAVNQARTVARRKEHQWDIARERHPHFPGQIRAPKNKKGQKDSEGWWVMDMWLPRACWKAGVAKDESWETVLRKYAVTDAIRTLQLWIHKLQPELKKQGLYDVYEEHRLLLRDVFEMESHGVTVRPTQLQKKLKHIEQQTQIHETEALKTVSPPGQQLELNLSSAKDRPHILHNILKLPVLRMGRDGPSTAQDIIAQHLATTKNPQALKFLRHFKARNEYNAIGRYLNAYLNFAHRSRTKHNDLFYRLFRIHPNFNPTGTSTTRFSSSNPNLQNVSKKIKPCFWCAGEGRVENNETCPICLGTGWADYSLRSLYGPGPGRVWASADYSNIEMRILALMANVGSFIDIFKSGKSVHVEVAKIMLEKSIWSDPDFKKTDFYRHMKNGNFSISYGAGPPKAETTYKVKDAFDILHEHHPEVINFASFGKTLEQQVRNKGFIKTLGDYQLLVPQDKPYAVLNYLVQGSAGIVMKRALHRCSEWCRNNPSRDVKVIMTIHDELVFDMPDDAAIYDNIASLCDAMESPGTDFDIPLPVEPELHRVSWAEGEDINPWWMEYKAAA